jgi:hypothetical protein
MVRILDLGRRIELTSMDKHFHDITIGLYALPAAAGSQECLVHSYSHVAGADGRVAFLVGAMQVLGGMLRGGRPNGLRFPCGALHRLAAKRVFLEACKLAPERQPQALPLATLDKRAEATVLAESLGQGRYRFHMDKGEQRRAAVAASGLRKLADLPDGEDEAGIAFACGHAHDALVGLLLPRALNVRAALREYEAQAARGVLVAPSAQAGGPQF